MNIGSLAHSPFQDGSGIISFQDFDITTFRAANLFLISQYRNIETSLLMSKGLGYVLLCFCLIVGAYYISAVLGNLSALRPSPPVFTPLGLVTVNSNFFGKQNLTGKSYITQGYGVTQYSYMYKNHWHDGVDVAASYGITVYSPNTGTVIATGNQDNYCYHLGFGKYIAVKDPVNNLVLWYGHLGTIAVAPGRTIAKGDAIGTVGATGYETGVHLHFSIFEGSDFKMQVRDGCGPEPTGRDVNPLNYLGSIYK
jgi:murein DD-endopeptidase MepM/ murein hydrolase activator NlpD